MNVLRNAVNVIKKLGAHAHWGAEDNSNLKKSGVIIAPKLGAGGNEAPWKLYIADKDVGVFVLPDDGFGGDVHDNFFPPASSGLSVH